MLEGTPHTMMVGEGAERLALEDPPLQLVGWLVNILVLADTSNQQAGRADLVTKAGEEEWER